MPKTKQQKPPDLLSRLDALGGGLDETGMVPDGKEHAEAMIGGGLALAFLALAAWRWLGHPHDFLPPELEHHLVGLLALALGAALLLAASLAAARALMIRRTLGRRCTFQVLTGNGAEPPEEAIAAFAHQMLGARRRMSLLRWLDEPATAFRVLMSRDGAGRPAMYWQVPQRFAPVLEQAARSYRTLELREVDQSAGLPSGSGRRVRMELRTARAEAYPLRPMDKGWDRLRGLADALGTAHQGEALVMAWDFLPIAPADMVPVRRRLLSGARRGERRDPLQVWNDRKDITNAAEAIERRIERGGLWEKVGGAEPMYRMTVLVCAESGNRHRARRLVERAWAACEQWSGQNFLRATGLSLLGWPIAGSDAVWRRWWFDHRLEMGRFAAGARPGRVVSWQEVGELFRGWGKAIEGVERREAVVEIAEEVPASGIRLGTAAGGREVALSPTDATHHVHVIGPWGAGKSTLTIQMGLDAGALRPQQGRPMGFCYIDQKDGKAFRDLLERIPEAWRERVVVIDPAADHDRAVGLNVFDAPEGMSREMVADRVLDLMQRQYGQYWQHRQADILSAAVLTLARHPDSTLCDVPELLRADPDERRARWTGELDDPLGLESFWAEYDGWSDTVRSTNLAPLMSKLRPLLMKQSVRHMIGQSRSTVDVGRIMDEGRILLVNLAPGILGEEHSRLLGSLLLTQFWQAAQARAGQRATERNPYLLIMDECQKAIAGLPGTFEQVLAEARAYGLCLVLAHQWMNQLPEGLRSALANARSATRVAFGLGDDAKALASAFWPLGERDLREVPRWHAAVRPHAGDGAFLVAVRDLPPGLGQEHGDRIARAALDAYGRPRAEVEDELRQRLGVRGRMPTDEELGEDMIWS